MKNFKKAVIALLVVVFTASIALFITACESTTETIPTQIVNGGFENNADSSTWTGWKREGSAFSARGVISETTVNGVDVDKTGEKFFSGLDGGTQKMTGTLTSDVFELTGTGFVVFKMGAAKNADKIYVEFFEEDNSTALAKVTNVDYDGTWITDQLVRKVVDLSAHIGKKLYVVVTDNDNTDDCGYVNLDDFKVCLTQEELDQANAERTSQLEKYGEPVFEEDPTSTTIVNGGFETGDLTGWKLLNGTALTANNIVSTNQYYWDDRAVYGNGEYYLDGSDNGNIAESNTGAIRSTKFTLAGDGYISFMIGAGSNSSCYVALCGAETDEELIVVTNKAFNDPKLALTLLRVYVDASEYLNEVLYIKVVDNNSSSGFAFINVDDFRVSLTETEVKALQTEQYKAIVNETYQSASYNDLASLKEYYATYDYLFELDVIKFNKYADNVVTTVENGVNLNQYIENVDASYGTEEITDITITKVVFGEEEYVDGFDSFDFEAGIYTVIYTAKYGTESVSATFSIMVADGELNVVNGGFETGDLTGWTVLTEGWSVTEGKYDGVINAQTYWNEGLPYNQSGNYHLDGWNTGIAESETWAIRSSTFVLGGSGYISVKMGGHAAAVRVYTEDGTLIGYYTQERWNDTGFPDITKGSWADMATYVMYLGDYVGEKLYIELCDEDVVGWAHAFFDEVVTYYEEAPDYANLFDTVKNGTPEKEDVNIPWVLAVNSCLAE